MKSLNQANIDLVRTALKGARLVKFDASIAILKESIAQGAWVLRGSVKASSGFYQGLTKVREPYTEVCSTDWYCVNGVSSVLKYGRLSFMDGDDGRNTKYNAMTKAQRVIRGIKVFRDDGELKKVSDEVVLAWIALCVEYVEVADMLNAARPLPVVTAIGLSPKVTATLTEMNLDLDLPSIKPAKIETRYRDRFDKNGKPMFMKDGTRTQEPYHVVAWTKGIVHGASRFGKSGNCEACNKRIPSGRFVPVEAMDKKSGLILSLWLGCDCARNIFGIKDVGFKKTTKVI